jgi:hypothetical protein
MMPNDCCGYYIKFLFIYYARFEILCFLNFKQLAVMSSAYSTKNEHPRDHRITFEPITHTYEIDQAEKYISTTTLIHRYFPEFDADTVIRKMMKSHKWEQSPYFGMTAEAIKKQWDDTRDSAAAKGTRVHDWIENFYLQGCSLDKTSEEAKENKSFQNFLRFHQDFGWKAYRTEWRIFTEQYKIAGSIDILFEGSGPGKIKLYDWKNSKEIKTENRYEKGREPLAHLPHCNFMHYSLQLNLYKWILERHYNVCVEEMGLIVVHESLPSYRKIRVENMTKEVEKMLEHYKEISQEKKCLPVAKELVKKRKFSFI